MYHKGFTPAHKFNEHLLNEDGIPKVFCHGTNERFNTFSPDEFSPIEGLTNEIDKLPAGRQKLLNRTDAQKLASRIVSNHQSEYSRGELTNE